MPLTVPHWKTGSFRTRTGICEIGVAVRPHLPGYWGHIVKEQCLLQKPESSSKHTCYLHRSHVWDAQRAMTWGNGGVQTNLQFAPGPAGTAGPPPRWAPSTNWPSSHQVLSPRRLPVSFPNLGPFLLVVPTLMTEINPWHFPTAKSS